MNPGDLCQLIGGTLVRHIEPCSDGFRTGVVTDAANGKIVPVTQGDYVLDGSPDSVRIVREARGLPPLAGSGGVSA